MEERALIKLVCSTTKLQDRMCRYQLIEINHISQLVNQLDNNI